MRKRTKIKVVMLLVVILIFATFFTVTGNNGNDGIRCHDCHRNTQYLARTRQMEQNTHTCSDPCSDEAGACMSPRPRRVIYGETIEEVLPQFRYFSPWTCDGCAFAFVNAFVVSMSYCHDSPEFDAAMRLYENPSLRCPEFYATMRLFEYPSLR